MPSKLLVPQILFLPKLHHRKQHDKGTEDKMPLLEFNKISVGRYDGATLMEIKVAAR